MALSMDKEPATPVFDPPARITTAPPTPASGVVAVPATMVIYGCETVELVPVHSAMLPAEPDKAAPVLKRTDPVRPLLEAPVCITTLAGVEGADN